MTIMLYILSQHFKVLFVTFSSRIQPFISCRMVQNIKKWFILPRSPLLSLTHVECCRPTHKMAGAGKKADGLYKEYFDLILCDKLLSVIFTNCNRGTEPRVNPRNVILNQYLDKQSEQLHVWCGLACKKIKLAPSFKSSRVWISHNSVHLSHENKMAGYI